MEASRAQKSYEELFLEVNPLQNASANKGKSKDIHLENIDVSFGSLRILSNATITLAEGRYALLFSPASPQRVSHSPTRLPFAVATD